MQIILFQNSVSVQPVICDMISLHMDTNSSQMRGVTDKYILSPLCIISGNILLIHKLTLFITHLFCLYFSMLHTNLVTKGALPREPVLWGLNH